jgi:hypothetical protein
VSLERWRRSIGLGEVLILFYLLAFVRQYFWVFSNNRLAWILTIFTTALICLLSLKFNPSSNEKTPVQFWFVVVLPLLLFYLLRVPFPDISFDVLNYRLVQSERALYGPPFMRGDFFPVIFPLNPSPDLVTGIFRHFLGYRLGTVINYLTIVWMGLILNKLMRTLIPNSLFRSIAILLILLTEHIFFQINTYMVDLLPLPLLLAATWLTFNYRASQTKQRDLIVVAALLGSALAIKLSNVTAVIPLTLWFAFEFFSLEWRLTKKSLAIILVGTAVFFLPLLPHAIYVYRETGSPFFPLYNEIFKSAYWPEINVGDGRWGPRNWFETLIWPFLTTLYPKRLSELGLYSGRLALSWISALICLFAPKVSRSMRGTAFVVLLGSLLWSLTSGYIRYALFFEVLGGVLLVYLVVSLRSRLSNKPAKIGWAVVSLPVLILIAQACVAMFYAYQTEWGRRLTFFDRPQDYFSETRYFFHDHNLSKFLTADKKPLIWNVEGWIVSSVKSSGTEVLLRNDVPMLGVHNLEYFDMPKSRERFANALAINSGKRIFSLALTDESETAMSNMRRRGFQVGEPIPLRVPFYSNEIALSMVIFEVFPASKLLPPRPNSPITTAAVEPLADDAYSAELSMNDAPARLKHGEKLFLNVNVKNASSFIWPARGSDDGRFFIRLANAWFDNHNNLVNNMDGRSNLPYDMWPGETVEIPLTTTTPASPGEYILEIDMVQEGVTFFKAKGSPVLRFKILVE